MKSGSPPRLRHDEGAPHLLRVALHANTDEPSVSELDALAAGLGIVPVPAHPPAPDIGPLGPIAVKAVAAGGSKLLSTVLAPVLIGALAGTAVWTVAAPSRPVSSIVAPPSSHQANDSLSARLPKPVPPMPARAPSEPAVSPDPAPIEPDPRPHAAPAAKEKIDVAPVETTMPQASPPDAAPILAVTAPESEASYLERAKALVDARPREAFALATEHGSRFPRGILQQEAGVIAIEALARAGRTTVAAEHLRQFRQRFPNSAYLPHLEAVVRSAN
jgi:hypothetical protein